MSTHVSQEGLTITSKDADDEIDMIINVTPQYDTDADQTDFTGVKVSIYDGDETEIFLSVLEAQHLSEVLTDILLEGELYEGFMNSEDSTQIHVDDPHAPDAYINEDTAAEDYEYFVKEIKNTMQQHIDNDLEKLLTNTFSESKPQEHITVDTINDMMGKMTDAYRFPQWAFPENRKTMLGDWTWGLAPRKSALDVASTPDLDGYTAIDLDMDFFVPAVAVDIEAAYVEMVQTWSAERLDEELDTLETFEDDPYAFWQVAAMFEEMDVREKLSDEVEDAFKEMIDNRSVLWYDREIDRRLYTKEEELDSDELWQLYALEYALDGQLEDVDAVLSHPDIKALFVGDTKTVVEFYIELQNILSTLDPDTSEYDIMTQAVQHMNEHLIKTALLELDGMVPDQILLDEIARPDTSPEAVKEALLQMAHVTFLRNILKIAQS